MILHIPRPDTSATTCFGCDSTTSNKGEMDLRSELPRRSLRPVAGHRISSSDSAWTPNYRTVVWENGADLAPEFPLPEHEGAGVAGRCRAGKPPKRHPPRTAAPRCESAAGPRRWSRLCPFPLGRSTGDPPQQTKPRRSRSSRPADMPHIPGVPRRWMRRATWWRPTRHQWQQSCGRANGHKSRPPTARARSRRRTRRRPSSQLQTASDVTGPPASSAIGGDQPAVRRNVPPMNKRV